jgi:hypothetical protein
MRPLIARDRTAKNAGLYLDGLLGDERRSGEDGYADYMPRFCSVFSPIQ